MTNHNDEFEFTAAYGTAVTILGRRRSDIGSRQHDQDVEAGGNEDSTAEPHWTGRDSRSAVAQDTLRTADTRTDGREPRSRGEHEAAEREPHGDMKRRRNAA